MLRVIARLSCLLALAVITPAGAHAATVSVDAAQLDAGSLQPFTHRYEKYKAVEQTGEKPRAWAGGSWADGAVSEVSLVADAGDGKPAVRLTNISGRPSGMIKTWAPVELQRGGWTAEVVYRKPGKSRGRLELAEGQRLDLPPTGHEFKTATLSLDVTEEKRSVQTAFQLYGGTGEGEAMLIRSFRLVRADGAATGAEAGAAPTEAERSAEARAVAEREAARRAAERKPIHGWVRPEAKPVKMDKPLDPPPVTGKTYFVATTGDDSGDGSKDKPWKTIQHGMNQLHPGDRLYVRGGEYRESMLGFARSGQPDAYITVAGYPGETAKVIHGGNGLAVFSISSGSRWTPIRLEEQAYLVIRDLHIDAVGANQAIRIHGPMMLDEYKGNLAKSRGLVHNIWVTGCDITGGNGNESVLGAAYGAHDVVISNNRIHNMVGGVNAFLYSDGTIMEWNTVHHTSREQDDAGAIKSMAPAVIIRYNTVYSNNRSPTATKPGWAPASRGGKQWNFLQGVTGIYADWAQVSENNNNYPPELVPADPANYIYGNTIHDNNAGIYIYRANHAQVYDNVIHGNGRTNTGGWVEGKEGGKWLEFVGPAGNGIAVTNSENVKVFNNLSYNNPKAGLVTTNAPGFEGFGNVFFGNHLAQVHLRRGDEPVFGFNTILAVEPQGPPFRRLEADFATVYAFRQAHPLHDEGTRVVPVPAGTDPAAFAAELRESETVSDAQWYAARDRLRAAAQQAGFGAPPQTVPQAPFDPTRSLQEPLPWAIPGIIEAEHYDLGGEGVSFHDQETASQGGHYRSDAVDIKASRNAGNGAVVGYTRDGEWMEYTVQAAAAGPHRLTITYATPGQGRRIRLWLNDRPLGQPLVLPPTGGWDELTTVTVDGLSLPQGRGVLRLGIEAGPVDLDRLEFAGETTTGAAPR